MRREHKKEIDQMKEVQKKFWTKKQSPKEEERIALKEKRRTSEKGEKNIYRKKTD